MAPKYRGFWLSKFRKNPLFYRYSDKFELFTSDFKFDENDFSTFNSGNNIILFVFRYSKYFLLKGFQITPKT